MFIAYAIHASRRVGSVLTYGMVRLAVGQPWDNHLQAFVQSLLLLLAYPSFRWIALALAVVVIGCLTAGLASLPTG